MDQALGVGVKQKAEIGKAEIGKAEIGKAEIGKAEIERIVRAKPRPPISVFPISAFYIYFKVLHVASARGTVGVRFYGNGEQCRKKITLKSKERW